MRDSCWIRSFALTKAFGPSEKDSDAFAQASAREASKVEALPEARRGSGAVVEAVASPDLLQYNSRDHEKKKKRLASRVRFFSQAGEGQLLIDRLCLFYMFSIPYNTHYNYTKAERPLTIEARSSLAYSIWYR